MTVCDKQQTLITTYHYNEIVLDSRIEGSSVLYTLHAWIFCRLLLEILISIIGEIVVESLNNDPGTSDAVIYTTAALVTVAMLLLGITIVIAVLVYRWRVRKRKMHMMVMRYANTAFDIMLG